MVKRKSLENRLIFKAFLGAPRGIRTHDLLIRSQGGGLQKPTRKRHFLRFMINLTTILTTKPDFLEHFGAQFLAVV